MKTEEPEDIFAPVRHLEGKRVLITSEKHPWVNYTGRIVGFEMMKVLNKPGCIVQLDTIPEHRVTIFNGKDIKMI